MSRIIVKNLPKQITSEKVKTLFAQKGEVTDVQLKTDQKGKFRGFAFVGFKTETQAKEAQEYFDKNYVNTNKIRVEICNKQSKKDLSKDDSDEQPNQDESKPKAVKDEFNELMNDSEFQEFLKVQRNLGKRKKIWEDDAVMDEMISAFKKQKPNEKNENDDLEDNQKDSEAVDETETKKRKTKAIHKYTIKIKNVPEKHKNKTSIRKFFDPIPLTNIRIPNVPNVAYVSFKGEKEMKQALIKHKSFLGKKQVLLRPMVPEENEENVQLEYNKHKNRIEKSVPVENIETTGRLFVRNLNYNVTQTELENLFNKYGPTTEVTLPVDTQTEKIKGFAFVTYMFPEHALKAFSELDRTDFLGRLLHIIPAEAKHGDSYNEMPTDKSSFKKQKTNDAKQTATRSHNWNALFLRADAVADLTSEKLNITKSQLLMDDANNKDSLAARMALAETQLVQETKEFLEQNGVHLKSFDEYQLPRSRTIMLIKNLPAKTDLSDLKQFIEKFGKIKKILLPPTGLTAIVEMNSEAVALQAFKNLAYTKYKRMPLYLEWAPVNVFKEQNNPEEIKNDNSASQANKQTDQVQVEEDQQPETNTVIYVKNLNTETTEKSLLNHFSQIGKVYKVTIAEKKSSDGKNISMGFGFVQYYKEKSAKKALKKLELTKLDGNPLSLKLSANPATNNVPVEKKQKPQAAECNKLLVKNVPFQATEKDLRQLFTPFGQLTSVRLPKKLTGNGTHRGFGFVEFSSKNEAKKAMEALSISTHLYGRRLNLEWAKKEE